jgi:hypothetical protein
MGGRLFLLGVSLAGPGHHGWGIHGICVASHGVNVHWKKQAGGFWRDTAPSTPSLSVFVVHNSSAVSSVVLFKAGVCCLGLLSCIRHQPRAIGCPLPHCFVASSLRLSPFLSHDPPPPPPRVLSANRACASRRLPAAPRRAEEEESPAAAEALPPAKARRDAVFLPAPPTADGRSALLVYLVVLSTSQPHNMLMKR